MEKLSKPIIGIPCFEDVNPYMGLPMFVKEIAKDLFTLVTEKDITENPSLYENITGILAYPSWHFMTTTSILDKLKNLKAIATTSAGYNHLDLKYLKTRNIQVGYTPDALSDAVADMAMTLILASARKLRQGMRESMGTKDINGFTNTTAAFGRHVSGTVVGIVGMGRIGLETARRCTGFRMKILYHNRNKSPNEKEVNAQYCPTLHAMLPECDFVVIACPMSESTTKLFGDKEFQLMKKTATIVNVSRGGIMDHTALTNALKSGEIEAAALDVTEPEPLPRDHPLLKLDNVIISPHSGSGTVETRRKMFQFGIDNLKAALIDNAPLPSELTF